MYTNALLSSLPAYDVVIILFSFSCHCLQPHIPASHAYDMYLIITLCQDLQSCSGASCDVSSDTHPVVTSIAITRPRAVHKPPFTDTCTVLLLRPISVLRF